MADTDRLIAMAIIDATDDNGRLILPLEDIHEALDASPDLEIDLEEVVAVLHRLQQFEPAGVCTRDLQECLLVQHLRTRRRDRPASACAATHPHGT